MVLERFRGLFRGGKGSRELRTDDLPGYFSEQEKEHQRRLAAEVDAHRSQIREAIEGIRGILEDLEEGEQKMGTHPRLEKIGKSALPQLVRSLRMHINRPLPEDPDSYYQEAGNVLKGCIEALRGAGKYLPPIFPEEMKALRSEIRTLGQSINAMTATITQLREEERTLKDADDAYRRLVALRQENRDRITYAHALEQKIQAIESELEDVRRSLAELPSRPEYEEVNRRQTLLSEREAQWNAHHLQSERIYGTVLSVYRRALRLARRHGGKEAPALLDQAIEIVSIQDPGCEEIRIRLERSISILTEMIQRGELILKGQEENSLFGDEREMAKTVVRNCEERVALKKALVSLRDEISRSPLIILREALTGDQDRLEARRSELLEEHHQEQERIERYPREETAAIERLAKAIEALPGEIRWIP